MTTTAGLGQFATGLLIKKLDMAMQVIARAKFDDRLTEEEKDAAYQLEGHGLVYAGLLSDIQANRVDGSDPKIRKLVGIAEEYIQVVNSTFPSGAGRSSV